MPLPTAAKEMKSHNEEKMYKCNQCDSASSCEKSLRIHVKRHAGEKPNKCNVCDFASFGASELKIHFKTHTGFPNFLKPSAITKLDIHEVGI